MQKPDHDTRAHWGGLGTLLWAALVAAVYLAAGTVVTRAYVSFSNGALTPREFSEALLNAQYDGQAIALSVIVAALACTLLLVMAVKLKRGANLRDYLGWYFPPKAEVIRWVLFFIGFLAMLDLITYLLGRPIVPEFSRRMYSSVSSHWLLSIALIVAAPLVEELFFRGFLLKGLAASLIGPAGAVILTSAGWAIIHSQYDAYGIGSIFIMGLILGAAKIKTGSTILAVLLHAIANLIATIETIIFLSYFAPGS